MGDRDRVVGKVVRKGCQKAVRKSGKKRRPLGGGGVKYGKILAQRSFLDRIKKEQENEAGFGRIA